MRIKVNDKTIAVAHYFLQRPRTAHWGYQISKDTGVRTGSLYPILSAFEEVDWIEDSWEPADAPHLNGRPPRRLYALTEKGAREMGGALQRRPSRQAPRARTGPAPA